MLDRIVIQYHLWMVCRFDIEGDEDTQMNFTSGEHTQIPTTLKPSPPPQEEPQRGQCDDAFNAFKHK